jgi:hypothetical protein
MAAPWPRPVPRRERGLSGGTECDLKVSGRRRQDLSEKQNKGPPATGSDEQPDKVQRAVCRGHVKDHESVRGEQAEVTPLTRRTLAATNPMGGAGQASETPAASSAR